MTIMTVLAIEKFDKITLNYFRNIIRDDALQKYFVLDGNNFFLHAPRVVKVNSRGFRSRE